MDPSEVCSRPPLLLAVESLEVHRALPLYDLLLLPDSDIMFLMTVRLPRLRAYKVLSLVSGQSLLTVDAIELRVLVFHPAGGIPMKSSQ
jgi:hypothetical protein